MRPLLRRLADCRRGAAAVEFALVAPLLIVLHLGVVEMVQLFEANRRVSHIAAALADLTAQERAVSSAEVDDILSAGSLMIAPFPASRLGARMTSFVADSGGSVSTGWTRSRNWTAGGSPTLPSGYLLANEGLVAVEVTYTHRPMFALVLPGSMTLRKQAYLRPRLSNSVALTN